MADAWARIGELNGEFGTGKPTSGMCFGTREHLQNNYDSRFFGAVVGLYANSADEAICPSYRMDAAGQPLDGSKYHYVLRFPPVSRPGSGRPQRPLRR